MSLGEVGQETQRPTTSPVMSNRLLFYSVAAFFFWVRTVATSECNFTCVFKINARQLEMGAKVMQADLRIPDEDDGVDIVRGGIRMSAIFWPFDGGSKSYIVPYRIARQFTEAHRVAILSAMEVVEAGSNIRFRESRSADKYFLDYVPDGGYVAYIGVMAEGPQTVSLEIGSSEHDNCICRPVVLHLLLHALGIGHEHQRSDRDRFIFVDWYNIARVFTNQLAKDNTLDAGECTPYDYASIMHYHYDALTVQQGLATLKPKYKEGYMPLQMPKDKLSSCDLFELNSIYPLGGYKYFCRPNNFPEQCIPRATPCNISQRYITCDEYCAISCDPEVCLKEGGEMSTRKRKGFTGEVPFDDCRQRGYPHSQGTKTGADGYRQLALIVFLAATWSAVSG